MDFWLRSLLRCPLHPEGGPLTPRPAPPRPARELLCALCDRTYPVIDGIPDLLGAAGCPAPLREQEAAQWDGQARHYDGPRRHDPTYAAGVAAAARALAPRPGELVLDAACGTGLTARAYDRPGLRVVAVDLSLESLRAFRAALPGASFRPVRADLAALPFAPGTFDRVLCANALQQVPGTGLRRACVVELARVARPGGRVVVTVHSWSPRKRRAGWPKEGPAGGASGAVRYIYRFEVGEFRELLASALSVEAVRGAGLPLPYRWKLSGLSRCLERVLSEVPAAARWGHMLVGVGRTACRVTGPAPRPQHLAGVG